jgi:dienelactone hydrolase
MLPIAWLACADPHPEPASATSVRFDPAGDLDWGDVGWPSDLHLDDHGRIALGALPADTPLAEPIRARLASRDGACTSCALSFLVDGELDGVPGEVGALGDPIVLVDLETGDPVPLRVEAADGRLTARPTPGHVLRSRARYAFAVTDALAGADGRPLAPSPAFDDVRRARPGADPRARALLEPAFAVLDRDHVVGLTVFTTTDPTREVRALRDVVRGWSFAPPVVDAVWTGADLDELLGVPGEDRPGADVPPAPGTEGTAAIPHETTAIALAGRFRAPRFVEGTGTDVGLPLRDDDGLPYAVADDEVPFLLIVPEGADVARLPVVVAHHGFNASRTTAFAFADTVGRAGFAVLAIDAYQHGARAASAVDLVHAMRGGVPGADGFAETEELDVSGRVFGLLGTPSELALSPDWALGAFGQFAADALSTVALARDGDWSAVASADPRLAGLAFDPDRIAFLGNSMGAVVGTSVLSAEPDVGAGVLNVLPGGIVDTLAESGEFRFLVDGVLLPLIGVDPASDVGLDPLVDLYRQVLEPVDPLALAPDWGAGVVIVNLEV